MPSGTGISGLVDKGLMCKESGKNADNGPAKAQEKVRLPDGQRDASGRPGAVMKEKKRKQRLGLANTIGHKVSQSGVDRPFSHSRVLTTNLSLLLHAVMMHLRFL